MKFKYKQCKALKMFTHTDYCHKDTKLRFSNQYIQKFQLGILLGLHPSDLNIGIASKESKVMFFHATMCCILCHSSFSHMVLIFCPFSFLGKSILLIPFVIPYWQENMKKSSYLTFFFSDLIVGTMAYLGQLFYFHALILKPRQQLCLLFLQYI